MAIALMRIRDYHAHQFQPLYYLVIKVHTKIGRIQDIERKRNSDIIQVIVIPCVVRLYVEIIHEL